MHSFKKKRVKRYLNESFLNKYLLVCLVIIKYEPMPGTNHIENEKKNTGDNNISSESDQKFVLHIPQINVNEE